MSSEPTDWRDDMIARIRKIILEADPEAVEERKWSNVPVWSHAGIICTGESYKSAVKMTFARGAALKDPSRLFNSSLEGGTRRAIDLHEGDSIDAIALKALIRAAVALNLDAEKKIKTKKESPMTTPTAETRSVIVERTIAHPPEKIWRALTQPHLIAEWLMKSDFKAVIGQRFEFTEDWGSISCEVLEIEPQRTLAYKWDAFGLESVVTWTLTATDTGTHLRMEQAGFKPDQEQAYQGARMAWPNYLEKLEQVLGKEQ